LVREGKFDEANAHFQKALEIDPGYAAAHNGVGIVLAREAQLDQAIAHWRKAVEINPRYADAYYNLGVAMVREGKYDEAIVHLQKALEIKPNYVEALYSLGVTFYLRGGIAEALVHWRRGLSLEPNNPPLLNQIAWVLATCSEASVRNGSEAVKLAERAVRLSGGREPAILDALAAAYAELGRFPESLQTARRALFLAIQQNKQPLAEALRARIALYEARTPFRETRQPSSH
jgi:superkiller protein 3